MVRQLKYRLRGFSLMAACIVLLALPGCLQSDESQIREAYKEFQAAVIQGEGLRASRNVSQATIEHFGELLELARAAGPDEVLKRPPSDRLLIAMCRMKTTPGYLRDLTGSQFYMLAVSEGWTVGSLVQGIGLGRVMVNGSTASGEANFRSGRLDLSLDFVEEKGGWKIDYLSLAGVVDDIIGFLATSEGVTAEQWILDAVSDYVGKPVTEKVWNKPV